MQLKLTFRDIYNVLEPYTLEYEIRDSKLGKVWCDHLIENFFLNDHPVEKVYCLKGWQHTWDSQYSRNLDFLCSELNKHIKIINKDMPQHGYPYIDLKFNVKSLKKRGRDLLNKIHHHFELLIGQLWDPSDWYPLAQEETRYSIRMLNNYCHEIESVLDSIEDFNPRFSVGLNGIDSRGRYFTNKKMSELTLEEYQDFSETRESGTLLLYYAQLGKSHREVFNDKDEEIDKKNISGIRYVTGEFIGNFESGESFREHEEYVKWLQANDFDINDPTLALEWGVVADLINDVDLEELIKRDDFYQMTLINNGQVLHNKTFDYTWRNQFKWEQDNYNQEVK